MNKKFNIFLYKTALFAVSLFVLFEVLFHLGFYPIITNSTLFDLKMINVQKRHLKSVKLLSMGSSVALYELNSGMLVRHLRVPYYNFASWGLQMADMKVLLNSFVKEYQPEYVILCSSIGDFIAPQNDSYLNYTQTNRFFRNYFPEYFYFKNYASIYQVMRRKYKAYPIRFDDWGGASLTVPAKDINIEKWNEHDIFPTVYTQGQYAALDSLSAFLEEQKVHFIFAQAPIKASYTNTVQSQQILQSHFAKCRSIVEARGGVYRNYYNTAVFTDSLFFDQYHLQAAGGVVLTSEIAADLGDLMQAKN